MDYIDFSQRKCAGAYADLPKLSEDKIRDDFWRIIKEEKPDLYLTHGLTKSSNVYQNNFGLLKVRLTGKNLWLPEKEYASSYNIWINVDNAESVHILAKAVLKGDVFTSGTMQEQASYLDLLERFCFCYPLALFESIRKYAPNWYKPFLFSMRPHYIRGVLENNIDGLNSFVSYFIKNYNEMGFNKPQNAIKEYYRCYKKNFTGDLRMIEWSALSDQIDFKSFIPNWENIDKLDVDSVSFIGVPKDVIVFIISINDIFKFLNNKIKKSSLLADFISFSNRYFVIKNKTMPFVQIAKSDLLGLGNGKFLIDVLCSVDNMPFSDFEKHMNNLIRVYIEYINEKRVGYEDVKTVLDRIADLKYKKKNMETIKATFEKFDNSSEYYEDSNDFKI